MAEYNLLDQIQKLVKLQEIDAEVYEYKRELKEKPAFLEELKIAFEEKKATLNSLEENYKTLLVSRSTKEGDVKAKDEAIVKANAQLSQIKTNKEYTAKIAEIENLTADKSVIEEQIIISYDESDAIKAEIDKEKANLAEEEKKYNEQKKEIESSIKAIEDKIKVLEGQRTQISPDVVPSILRRYEQILENKEGVAIVPVEGHSCGGCFMNVPAQVVNEMKMHKDFTSCEMCARILYLKEDVE